jgi:hypothetical protein
MSRVKVKVDGLPELIRGLRDNAGLAKPFEKAFHRIGLEGSSASKKMAPVDTGLLRNRITYEVDKSPLPTFVRIGTIGSGKVNYAAYMEFGTGMAHDHPSWPKKPHRIPPGVLDAWAKRKSRSGEDWNAYTIGRNIMKRGGLVPRRFLRTPFEASRFKYVRLLSDALKEARLNG